MRYLLLLFKTLFMSVLLSVVFGGCYLFLIRSSIPVEYQRGERADELARSVQARLQREKWVDTGAIKWSFLDNHYLWDLRRGFVQVEYDRYKVIFDVNLSRAQVKMRPLESASRRWRVIDGVEANRARKTAYELWLRDRFILEPSQSLFNKGVYRYAVATHNDQPNLLVYYKEGGRHPGDTFLWELEDSFPVGIRFWSKQFPLSGFLMKMEGWRILDTGLKVSLVRSIGPITLKIQAKAARSLRHLIGKRKDPFEALLSDDPLGDPRPTSQPNRLDDPKKAETTLW